MKPFYIAPLVLPLLLSSFGANAADLPEMVTIPGKNYEMGKHEVTQAEWRAVMGNNPSRFKECGDKCPVEQVSWNEVQEFLAKLNQKTGKQYRLPTVAEWEYACYAGSKTDYCGGNDINKLAWYYDSSSDNKQTHSVGQKQPNAYGLYDMSGNVWEWTADCYTAEDCTKRVVRGGSWFSGAKNTRADSRSRTIASSRSSTDGFRLARTLP